MLVSVKNSDLMSLKDKSASAKRKPSTKGARNKHFSTSKVCWITLVPSDIVALSSLQWYYSNIWSVAKTIWMYANNIWACSLEACECHSTPSHTVPKMISVKLCTIRLKCTPTAHLNILRSAVYSTADRACHITHSHWKVSLGVDQYDDWFCLFLFTKLCKPSACLTFFEGSGLTLGIYRGKEMDFEKDTGQLCTKDSKNNVKVILRSRKAKALGTDSFCLQCLWVIWGLMGPNWG